MAQSANFAKTFLAFRQFGINVIREAKKNLLRKTRKTSASGRSYTSSINSTGSLYNSLKSKATNKGVEIEMDEHGEYVDQGRKKGKYAPPDEILKWVKQKPIRPRGKDGRYMRRGEAQMKSLAFLLNRSIFTNGIKPTHFISDPFDSEFAKLERKIPDLLEQDLDIYFED